MTKAKRSGANEMPPAVVAAEGKTENLDPQISRCHCVPVVEAYSDSAANGESVQVPVGVFDGDGRELVVLQRIENSLSDIRQFLLGQVVRRTGVADMSHDVFLSVGDAPDGAGVGASDSTERVYTAYGPTTGKPPAVAAAEGEETKTNR